MLSLELARSIHEERQREIVARGRVSALLDALRSRPPASGRSSVTAPDARLRTSERRA